MSIILKSNTALANVVKLSDKLSIAPVVNLDFRRDDYSVLGIKKDIGDVLDVERVGVAGGLDALGNYGEYSSNQPVISVEQSNLKKGLYVEYPNWNYFKDSSNPKTQVVSFTMETKHVTRISVVGSGSLELYSDGVLIGVAIESNAFWINPPTATKRYTLTAKVIGYLDYMQCSVSDIASSTISRIVTPTGDGASNTSSKIKIKRAVLDSALPTFNGCIVVKIHHPLLTLNGVSGYADLQPTRTTTGYFEVLTDAKKGVFTAYQSNGGLGHVLRSDTNTVADRGDLKPALPTNIMALNITPTRATAYVNGRFLNFLTFDNQAFRDIYLLGLSGAWSIRFGSLYLEQCVIYNRNLTEDELTRITSPD